MADFCHLHCHTQYSLLDGAAGIGTMLDRAAGLDIPAVAITDHGNLYGVPEFYTTARKKGVQPIIGCEFYVTPSGIGDTTDRTRYHQVLLAKNEQGYRNLIKLASISYTEGFYYKPRIDRALMRRYADGLVATTCCLQGEVLQTILKHGEMAAQTVFEDYLDIFGDDYYIELQDHDIDEQHRCNEVLTRWSKAYNVKVVATNDVHYVEQADAEAQDVLLCLQTGTDYHDPNRMRFENNQFYLKTADEMMGALTSIPEDVRVRALGNTAEVAAKCSFDLPMGDLLMPHYPIPDAFGDDMDAYLRHMVFERARPRYGDPLPQAVAERLDHELAIIKEMGYAGYFLIVQDFTTAARDLDVRVGPGRGSAAGSAVAYCLGITNVDPLEYDLLFERFLNPERVSMPDIDIDFDDRGRAKVIDYVVQKYGRENVCQIITFGTMGAKTVIRDVSRVLDIPLSEADRIAKLVPDGPKVSLDSAMAEVPELRDLKQADDRKVRKMMHYAEVLEGSARHTGVHAAGVIIAPGEVSNYVPVGVSKSKGEKVITTQYDGDWVEQFGLLKMDFLGLKTLTVLNDALDLIEKSHGVRLDLDALPLDDAATFELFQNGETVSIFQFESTGMREWLRKLKPTELNDLIAMNALYRPGPMDHIPTYIARKHGEEPVEYPHPVIRDILKPTYGIPVFQEQVMQMAQKMGQFSLGKADILRRGMGKKKQKVVDKMKGEFVGGARDQGIDDAVIKEVWEMMAKFAGYGFNKSHSAAYSLVAYQTGYLKAHYPAEFMAAAMTNWIGNNDNLSVVLEEARRMGLQVLPPDVNRSASRFTVDDGAIRFGLGAVKGAGLAAIDAILEARAEHGAFATVFGLTKNLDLRVAGKRTLESLALAGALDALGAHRAQLAEAADLAVRYGQKVQADRAAGQNSLFGSGEIGAADLEPDLPSVEPWSTSETLKREHEVLGFYVSGHPLDDYRAEADAFATARFGEVEALERLVLHGAGGDGQHGRDRGPVRAFCGILTEVKRTTTRSGKPMAFCQMEDFTGAGELVCFASILDRVSQYLKVDAVVLVRGNVEVRGGQVKCLVKDVMPMWKVRDQLVEALVVHVDAEALTPHDVEALRALCDRHRGRCKLYFDVQGPGMRRPQRVLARAMVVEPTSELLRGLHRVVGPANVRLEGAT